MEHTVNHIELRGCLHTLPEFSHENHGRRFFRFSLDVERLSGATDTLQILAAEELLNRIDLSGGDMLLVEGQIRSFNSRNPDGRKLLISVFAESLQCGRAEPFNYAILTGTVCKTPVFRRTPLGREICDIMLAVNRAYHRTDYLPCILWGRTAESVSQMPVGTQLTLCGRLQSRQYLKVIGDRTETRTAYEISAISAEPAESSLAL